MIIFKIMFLVCSASLLMAADDREYCGFSWTSDTLVPGTGNTIEAVSANLHRDDLLIKDSADGMKLSYGYRTGEFQRSSVTVDQSSFCSGGRTHAADINGDHRDDILCHKADGTFTVRFYSSGTYLSESHIAIGYNCPFTNSLHIGNFDGKAGDDIMCLNRAAAAAGPTSSMFFFFSCPKVYHKSTYYSEPTKAPPHPNVPFLPPKPAYPIPYKVPAPAYPSRQYGSRHQKMHPAYPSAPHPHPQSVVHHVHHPQPYPAAPQPYPVHPHAPQPYPAHPHAPHPYPHVPQPENPSVVHHIHHPASYHVAPKPEQPVHEFHYPPTHHVSSHPEPVPMVHPHPEIMSQQHGHGHLHAPMPYSRMLHHRFKRHYSGGAYAYTANHYKNGGCGAGMIYTFPTPSLGSCDLTDGISNIIVGDFNHDHIDDIACNQIDTGVLNFYLSNGGTSGNVFPAAGTLDTDVVCAFGATIAATSKMLIAADADGDGDDDLVCVPAGTTVAAPGPTTAIIHYSDGTTFAAAPAAAAIAVGCNTFCADAAGATPVKYAVGDYNEDGYEDFMCYYEVGAATHTDFVFSTVKQ